MPDASKQIPAWEFAVGRGWKPILDRLHERLAELDPGYEVSQVKEKYGGLRVYLASDETLEMQDAIDAAEAESLVTCERCGQSGSQQTYGGWARTTCGCGQFGAS